ncbi:MAG: hypothetical protein U1G07_06245 [Verrucomicrobiota bacterium]
MAGSGAKDGVAMAHYELHAWCLLVLAWVFVPFYAHSLVPPCRSSSKSASRQRRPLRLVDRLSLAFTSFPGRGWHLRRWRRLWSVAARLQLDLGGVHIDGFWISSVWSSS